MARITRFRRTKCFKILGFVILITLVAQTVVPLQGMLYRQIYLHLITEKHENKFQINISNFDTNLQIQNVYLPELIRNSTKNSTVFQFWRSICDERNYGYPKSVITYVFIRDNKFSIKKNIDKFYYRVSCRAYDSNTQEFVEFFDNSVVFTHYLNEGMIVICPFRRNLTCPNFVTLTIASNKPTHFISVEKQEKEEFFEQKSSKIIICAPAITNKISTVLPSRLAEYFEYNKLIGVKQIYMPSLNTSLYPLEGFNTEVEKLLQFYEKQNFLVRFTASTFKTKKPVDMFSHIRFVKPMHLSYCMVRVALKSDYVIVQDFDEVIGFNTNSFKTLGDVIQKLRSDRGLNYQNFMIRDTVFDHHCNPNVSQLNYSKFVISEAKYYFNTTTLNQGKTIHHSSACIVAFPHYCILYRTDEVLLQPPGSRTLINVENQIARSKRLFLASDGSVLRSFHFRAPENHHGTQAAYLDEKEKDKWCNASNWVQTDWIDGIRSALRKNSEKALRQLYLN